MSIHSVIESCGFIDLSSSGKLRFSGEQALWFLDQLLTNSFEDLAPSRWQESLLLTPKGRITAHLYALNTGGEVLVLLEGQKAGPTRAGLEERIFATRVEIEDVSEACACLLVLGPTADEAARQALTGAGIPGAGFRSVAGTYPSVIARWDRPLEGLLLWLPADSARGAVEALEASGAVGLSGEEYETLRVAAGVARYGRDFTEAHLPQEAAMERAVHFDKGCYLGQEAVAMAQRGMVKRRLRHLRYLSDPLEGRLEVGSDEVGQVTSVGRTPDGGWGIAMVHTSVPLDSEVRVVANGASSSATVHELPGTIHGPKVPSARELRERLKGTA